ncbi:MAG: phosphoribosylformylglycinamidine synthase subunit PurL, partial [Planctomycetota bacterium]
AGVVQGLAEACSALDLPVVGGNVSLYNGAGDTAVRPTPVVCTVGVIEDLARSRGAGFVAAGDAVLLVQTVPPTLAASLFWERFGGGLEGRPPRPRFEPLRALIDWLVDTARTGSLRSAHDVAHGGLAVALAECALLGGLGLEAALPPGGEAVEVLFGEAPGAVVVSCAATRRAEVVESARARGLAPILLGRTIAEPVLRIGCGPVRIETQLAQLRAVWGGAP